MEFKVNDIVCYNPRGLSDIHESINNAKIKMIEPRGNIFNQDMVVLEELEGWIPACDLTKIKEGT